MPANVAVQVRRLAKARRLSANRMLLELIENGMEAEKRKQQEFFDLAERFRNATDPANALLNYLYRLLEAECTIATQAVGLDPGLGVLHADSRGRASFVLDLIEAGRPIAERHLLRVLESTPLRWRDFDEDGHGVVRVLSPLTHRLAEALPAFGSALAPVVERIVRIVGSASPYDVSTPSVLTREKHKAAARRRVESQVSTVSAPRVGPGANGVGPRSKRRQKPSPELEAALFVCVLGSHLDSSRCDREIH